MTPASQVQAGAAAPGRSRFVLSDSAKYSIKLGLAIAVTYGLALRADWMSPTWAAIAVAMVGQPGHGQSLYKGMLRAVGTLIAFFCGLLILIWFPQNRWMTLVATTPFLGYFTYKMKGENAYLWFVAAFVTPMIVMAGPTQPGHAFEFASYRTLETLMGIGVWALVSIFLWPVTNRGALASATDQLLATQQKILDAFREVATSGDPVGVPSALQEQEAQLVAKVGSLIDVVAVETYEVRGVRGVWHRMHAASESFSHLSNRIQSGVSDSERVPLSSVMPGLSDFLMELHARLGEARDLLAGKPPSRPCQDVSLEFDMEAYGAQAHFARAGAEVSRAELAALDARTRTIVESMLAIKENRREEPSAQAARSKGQSSLGTPLIDRDQLKAALVAVLSMWVGTLIWIYINPPGHVSWFQFPTNLTLVALLNPHVRFFPLRVLGYAYLAAMLVYVFIMPHLSGFVQLGLLLFAFTFVTAYFFPRARTFLLLAMFNMFGIANEQTYDFASMMNAYVFTMAGILMVYGMTYLIGSPRPEKMVMRQLQRFFTSCEFLLSQSASGGSFAGRMKHSYHRKELLTLPAKISAWGSQIDKKRFPHNSPEQVKKLAAKLQLLSFRIDDLLTLRERSQEDLFCRDLRDDLADWQALLGEAFDEWSKVTETVPRGQSLSERRAQLNARLEEKASRLQMGDTDRQDFYRVLGAFRGVTRAGIGYGDQARDIDWAGWREEQFA